MKSKESSNLSILAIQRILISILIIVLFGSILASCSSFNTPTYEQTECQFYTESTREIDCGILTVPENRSKEEGPMIELQFAILRSNNPDKAPDPVVFLQGGPGVDALDMMNSVIYTVKTILIDRDVIVLDQRGVGFSQPSLNCPELEEPIYATYAQDLNREEQLERYFQAIQVCHDRLDQEGIDLSAYTSAENAADLDDLRKALGYSEWNLYGVSYGSRVALTVMRDFPDGVRSAILDSTVPLQINLNAGWAVNLERALKLLFGRCAADVECSQAYPDLEQVFYQVVDQLDAEPVTLSLGRSVDLENYEVLVNGDRFIYAFHRLLYSSEYLPSLPDLIYEIEAGEWGTFASMIRRNQFEGDGFNEGLHFSVHCTEEMPFSSLGELQAANADVDPRLVNGMKDIVDFQSCAIWEVSPAHVIEDEAVTSAIPTLILAGEHDPVTPPEFGLLAAETLSQAQYLAFPGVGHNVLGFTSNDGLCSSYSLVDAFLTAPDEPVDASCVAELPPLFGGD